MHEGGPGGTAPSVPVPPEVTERLRRIVALLDAARDPTGFVPFDRFMEIALYSPDVGFYDRPRSPLGPSGDFYTAPHVHPLFGRTVADRVSAVRRVLGDGRPFRVTELGGGDGTLSRSLLEGLGPADRSSDEVELVLVERSSTLAARALERVRPVAERLGRTVRIAGAVGETGPFEGIVVANEVMDAQPARRLRWTGTEWRELGIRLERGELRTAESAVARPVPPPALPRSLEPGGILEVAPLVGSLVREVADHLVRGELLVLDYGMEEDELLRGHPEGTLAAVRGHRSGLDPLASPGLADLSTFVNFTRFRAVARGAGLEVISDRSQAEALDAWGFSARFEEALRGAGSADEEVRLRLAVKNLLFGFERFRALELAPPGSAAALRPAR